MKKQAQTCGTKVLIKNCKKPLLCASNILWRRSIDTGVFPQSLKTTDIVPLHKGGSKAIAKNYRPTALMSHILKFFERDPRSKIANNLDTHKLYNPGQHGFRAGRSCLSTNGSLRLSWMEWRTIKMQT